MTGAREKGLRGSRARRDRLVAALLAVALLFCHGAFGALHQTATRLAEPSEGHHAPATPPAAVGHHPGHGGAAAEQSFAEHQVAHYGGAMAHADYAAALFVVLVGAVLSMFFAWSPARNLADAARPLGRLLAPFYLRPPRGPTLPLLQVFRL